MYKNNNNNGLEGLSIFFKRDLYIELLLEPAVFGTLKIDRLFWDTFLGQMEKILLRLV
jgi:hypothetical protein